MNIGTKSLLFGAHQFILHPIFTWIAWVRIYKSLPDWKEIICIIIHDWGYWNSPNMDGEEGEFHPYWAAMWAGRHLGFYYLELCQYHSRFMAKRNKTGVSKLCLPDKYGVALMPTWLWVLLARSSGELKEYMAETKYEINEPTGSRYRTPQEFFKAYKEICHRWVQAGDPTFTLKEVQNE